MQNLQKLNSKELLAQTQSLVAEERRITLRLIECLEEIQSRRLHNELGFSSLWEFCTQYLRLSEGAAQRRIAAMRLARDIPEAKVALQSGKLSLSNAAKVQSFRKALRKKGLGALSNSRDSVNSRISGNPPNSSASRDPRALIREVEGLSQRECEAKLFEFSPEALPRERERIVSATQDREIRLVISVELHGRLKRLKDLLAHARPNASYAELLEYLVNDTLPRIEKKKGIVSKITPVTPATAAAAVAVADAATASDTATANAATPAGTAAAIADMARALPAGKRIHLPAALRRAVFAPSEGCCEFVHNGRRCNSTYRLEIDHIRPLAYGGGHGLDQLRVLCKSHNLQQFQAWKRRGGSP